MTKHLGLKEIDKRLGPPQAPGSIMVAGNTSATRIQGEIGIFYHDTEVVRIHASGAVTLDTGGWHTPTTKKRINWFLPPGCQVYQADNIWYIWTPKGTWVYQDGAVVSSEGFVFDSGMPVKVGARGQALKDQS